MTIQVNKLIEVLAQLCEDKNLKATGAQCLRGGLMTGISATVGGLLLGPVGLAIGGVIGGISSAVAAKDFQPVAVILRQMTATQKRKLADTLKTAFSEFGIQDLVTLGMMLSANSAFQDVVIKELTNYFNREMNMKIRSLK